MRKFSADDHSKACGVTIFKKSLLRHLYLFIAFYSRQSLAIYCIFCLSANLSIDFSYPIQHFFIRDSEATVKLRLSAPLGREIINKRPLK